MEYSSEEEFLQAYNAEEFERLSVTVDLIMFGIKNQNTTNYRKLNGKKLSVLLNQRTEYPCLNKWSLPGGFVQIEENLDTAAERILERETDLKNIYMEQLYTFGKVKRDPRMRIISTAYMSLINRESLKMPTSDKAIWFDIDMKRENNKITVKLSHEDVVLKISGTEEKGKIKITSSAGFAFDHDLILLTGISRLKNKINYTDIVFNLLPKKFTLTELQMIYEAILNEKLFPAAFRRIIAAKVQNTGEYLTGAGHRPSQLYIQKKD